jgi:hypothetical protein
VEQINYNLVQGKNAGEKSRWHKIGEARKHDTGFWVRMDVMPIPNEEGQVWLQLYEREYDEVPEKKCPRAKARKCLQKQPWRSSQVTLQNLCGVE